MKKLILVAIILILGLTVLGEDEQLVIVGSTTVLPIAQASAEMYMGEYPEADITVRGGGSGVGIAALLDGTTHIANASREIKPEEIESAREKGIEPYDNIVAYDGIAIIVNHKTGIDNLTLEQLKKVFIGEIKNWSELGGIDEEIVVVSRDVSSGTFEVFKELVLDEEPVSDGAIRAQSNQAAVTTVKNAKSAIGYVGLGYVNSSVKAVSIDGIEANEANAASGKYPIVRSLHMYTNGEPTGMVKQFIDYVKSEEGQMVVKQLGYVGI